MPDDTCPLYSTIHGNAVFSRKLTTTSRSTYSVHTLLNVDKEYPPRYTQVRRLRTSMEDALGEATTTAVVQDYLNELVSDVPSEPVVRALLGRAVRRLHQLCATLLHRKYPRLVRPPLNLQSNELLGAVVERLMKALREARPASVRDFFALAAQHMRWELNDLARRLDEQPAMASMDVLLPASPASDSGLSSECRQILAAIDSLPNDEREVFDLVRMQGMSQVEVAGLLGVAPRTVRRRLDRGLLLLTERLSELRMGESFKAAY